MSERLDHLFSLAGKIALVTGGSRGIGEMIAEGFVDAGAKVIMTARKAEALEATADRLRSKGGDVVAVAGDLSTPDGVTAFAEAVKAETDVLHILVNNAGAAWGAPLGEYPVDGWDKVMNLSLIHI